MKIAIGVVASDERQLFKRRDVGSFSGGLSVVGHGTCDWIADHDEQSYSRIHREDSLDHVTVDQVARGLLHRQLTGCGRRHPRPTQTRVT